MEREEEFGRQLASLRRELRALGEGLHRLRIEDARIVYSGQVRSVLEERVRRYYAPAANGGRARCADPTGCAIDAVAFIDQALSAYRESGQEAGVLVVEEQATRLRDRGADGCPRCLDMRMDVAAEMRRYLEIGAGWAEQLGPGPNAEAAARDEAPEKVEAFLAPLCSSMRVGVMMLLDEGPMSLAEMSRRTSLVKGHLQFHLRSLTGAGLVDFDRRTKLYELSGRGGTALAGVLELMRRCEMAGGGGADGASGE
jgi:DNA-binding transcriptional ArsR family regulator